jgi:hypothetical protein
MRRGRDTFLPGVAFAVRWRITYHEQQIRHMALPLELWFWDKGVLPKNRSLLRSIEQDIQVEQDVQVEQDIQVELFYFYNAYK